MLVVYHTDVATISFTEIAEVAQPTALRPTSVF